MNTLTQVATALVAERLKETAVQQMQDLQVLAVALPATFLPTLMLEALQTVRNAGDDALLYGAVIEVDRFLQLARTAVEGSRGDGNSKPYRIFRRMLAYRKAAQHLTGTAPAPLQYQVLDFKVRRDGGQ